MGRRCIEEVKTLSAGLWNRKSHLGIEFVIWSREGTWFWFLVNPHNMGGMIGATSNQAQTMREASLAIEAILKRGDTDPKELSANSVTRTIKCGRSRATPPLLTTAVRVK
jgi:hypothetical protein